MSDPNIIDPEYNEFLKVFNGCWPTNYEFFLAACNWQKQKQEKVQGEPVGVVKRNGLGFPCVDLLGKNGAQYFGLEDGTKLYTSAPTIPEGWQLVPVEQTIEMQYAREKAIYDGNSEWDYMLSAAPKHKETK